MIDVCEGLAYAQPDEVWRYFDYIFSEGSLLLREEIGNKKTVLEWVRDAAEAFEFLSKFAQDDDKPILLLNAAICYHISGYQANAQCLAKVIENKFAPEIPLAIGEGAPDIPLTNFFPLTALLKFLKREISDLQQITSLFSSFSEKLQTIITEGLAEEKYSNDDMLAFIGHTFFQQSLVQLPELLLLVRSWKK